MRIASERPRPLVVLSVCVRVLLSLLHSRCYDAQHLKSGLFTAPLLRHLHGHCVVCYTVQCWLVFVVIIPAEERRREERRRVMFLVFKFVRTASLTVLHRCLVCVNDEELWRHIISACVSGEIYSQLHYLWQTQRWQHLEESNWMFKPGIAAAHPETNIT